jgi:hypothetical protein
MRASAWLAVFVATVTAVIWAVVAVYAIIAHRAPFRLSDAVQILTIALLVLGAVRAWRDADSRYLILSWGWLAGTHLPELFVTPIEPAYVLNAPAGPERALLYEAWQYGLRIQFFWATAYSAVAGLGLLLCLWPARLERSEGG